ncbi:hypothetical protein [Streptomyces blastmyceticus]|uniref:Uncharacterized protein n=1 Tax=Streptomyces blastmyceticus TaxID=68180 RepID=A0ABP3GHE0_9ACTN
MPAYLTSPAAPVVTSASVWAILGCVAAAGAVGGVINALLSDSQLILPREKAGILQPGFLGNALLGAFGAVITWGLYGPLKDAVLLGSHSVGELPVNMTVTALVGAALAGAGGARVVSAEVDKRYLRSAGASAAITPVDPQLATALRTASPSEAAQAASEKLQTGSGAPAATPASPTRPPV